MNKPATPHSKNAPGTFYVEHGCCMSCGVPIDHAPELFEYDAHDHCFVKQQPDTEDEVTTMIAVCSSSEAECIRYRGDDPEILRRFAELGEGKLCDVAPPAEIVPVTRDHVTFITTVDSASQLSKLLRRQLNGEGIDQVDPARFRKVRNSDRKASFQVAWYERNYHKIRITQVSDVEKRWLIQGPPFMIHSWLCSDSLECEDVRWYSESDWNGSQEFQRTPW